MQVIYITGCGACSQLHRASEQVCFACMQMLVKPSTQVLDFRTDVTGATEATMQVIACDLVQICM